YAGYFPAHLSPFPPYSCTDASVSTDTSDENCQTPQTGQNHDTFPLFPACLQFSERRRWPKAPFRLLSGLCTAYRQFLSESDLFPFPESVLPPPYPISSLQSAPSAQRSASGTSGQCRFPCGIWHWYDWLLTTLTYSPVYPDPSFP